MREWAEGGIFHRVHQAVLDRLGEQGRLDSSRASLDSVNVAKRGGVLTGLNPTDRGKRGTKHHLLVDATGLPLNIAVSGAHRHDSMLVEPILDGMPAIECGGRGHPRRRPVKLHADKGYDNPRVRDYRLAEGSPPVSRGSVATRASAWAATAGSWNAPSAGCCPTNASPCATTAPR